MEVSVNDKKGINLDELVDQFPAGDILKIVISVAGSLSLDSLERIN